jgi:hypothetical protein
MYDAEKGQVMNPHEADLSGDNAVDLYSGGVRYESRQGHRLFRIYFLIASRKIMNSFSNTHDRFPPNPSQFIILHSLYLSTICNPHTDNNVK